MVKVFHRVMNDISGKYKHETFPTKSRITFTHDGLMHCHSARWINKMVILKYQSRHMPCSRQAERVPLSVFYPVVVVILTMQCFTAS